MKFNTRVFWRVIAVFAILDACILMAGCGDWESQAVNIIGLLGPAIQAALAILAAFGVGVSQDVMATFNSWATQAENALVQLKGLIAQYKTALAAAQPGILTEIQTVVTTTAQNLASILPTLHITDANTQAKVEAVFAAISGMLAAVAALLPALTGQVTDNHEKLKLYRVYEATAKNFKATFNAAAGYFGKQYEI